MGPSLAVEGTTTREVFETYLEHVLASALKPRQLVVMDNLSSHKGERVRELIARAEVANFFTCRPTHRTITRLSKPSRKLRGSCGEPRHAPAKR
jgi:hypothetical protein